MRYLKFALVVAMLTGSVHAAEATTIADVATLKDLRAAPLLRLDDGTELRLGLSDGGDAAGPWRVLYCLVERRGKGEARRASSTTTTTASTAQSPRGEQLGPVSYEVTWAEPSLLKVVDRIKRQSTQTYPVLFAGRVLLHQRGRAIVHVYTNDGAALLAEREVEVKAPRENNWLDFVRPRQRDEAAGSDYIVSDEPWPAVPTMSDGGTGASISTTQPADAPLPAEVTDDAHADSRLRLSLEKDNFVLRAPTARHMPSVTDDRLIARWWINGKPAAPPPPRRRLNDFMRRQQRLQNEAVIRFGLPDVLGELKPGDRVALQLLWCPDGHERVRTGEAHLIQRLMRFPAIGWEWPVMTNRIEFMLTPELIAKRDNPLPEPRPNAP